MFADLKIRHKLFLLMLLPLSGFLIYSGQECINSYTAWKNMETLGQGREFW